MGQSVNLFCFPLSFPVCELYYFYTVKAHNICLFFYLYSQSLPDLRSYFSKHSWFSEAHSLVSISENLLRKVITEFLNVYMFLNGFHTCSIVGIDIKSLANILFSRASLQCVSTVFWYKYASKSDSGFFFFFCLDA